jgi:hypothetical protein
MTRASDLSRFLPLEQVEAYLRAGKPFHWVIIRDDETDSTVEMALNTVDHRAPQRFQRGGAS